MNAAPDPDLLLQHAGFLRALARSLLYDDHQADDVVAEAYAAAVARPPTGTEPRAWLGRVVRNLAMRRRRTEGRLARRERAAARPEAVPSAGETAARLETQRAVVDAVFALDEPYRSAVVLRYYDDLAPAAIARRLGEPVETVHTRLKRARRTLRQRLERVRPGWAALLLPLAGAKPAAAASGALLGWTMTTKALAAAVLLALAATLFLHFTADASRREGAGRAPSVAEEGERGSGGSGAAAVAAGGGSGAAVGTGGAENARLVRGRVRVAGGEPLPGADVRLLRWRDGARVVLAEGATDAAGAFALARPDGNNVYVQASHTEYVDTGVWVRGAAPEEVALALVPAARLRVRVLDPGLAPVAGATLTLARLRDGRPGINLAELGTEETGTDGTAEFREVPRGAAARVEVHARGFAAAVRDAACDADRELEIVLSRGGAVAGRVFDTAGGPVAGVLVRPVADFLRTDTTDGEGRYRIEGLEGAVEIVAIAGERGAGYFGTELGWSRPVAVPVREGRTTEGIDIRLAPPRHVRGRVVDGRGEPVAGLRLQLTLSEAFPQTWAGTTAQDGRFEAGPFGVVRQPRCWLSVPGGAHDLAENTIWFFADAGDLDLGDVKVHACGAVAGVVADAEGRPAGDVLVRTRGDVARTDAEGRFRIEPVRSGDVALEAESPTGRARLALTLAPGERRDDLRLVLEPVFAIRGTVRTPDGAPRRRVNVGALRLGAPPAAMAVTTTTDEGGFQFPALPEGEYRVGLVDGPGRLKESPAPVPALPERSDVELVAALAGAIVQGRVVDADTGVPLPRFDATYRRYVLFVPQGSVYESCDDPEGRFFTELDEPGSWTLEIDAEGRPRHTEVLDLKAGETRDLGEIRIGQGGTLEAHVVDAQQQPVAFARLHLLGPALEEPPGLPFTDAEGRGRYAGVPPGRYALFVVSPRHPLGILRDVDVAAGATKRVTVALPEPSPLEITVRDEAGRPVKGAELVYTFAALRPLTSEQVKGYEPPGFGSNESDAEGCIRKPTLPPGDVEILLRAEGFRPDRRTIALKAGETTRVEVRLEAAR